MSTSASYNKRMWKEDCWLLDNIEDEPCWGEVIMVDDGVHYDTESGEYYECSLMYACEGHWQWPNPRYIPEERKEK